MLCERMVSFVHHNSAVIVIYRNSYRLSCSKLDSCTGTASAGEIVNEDIVQHIDLLSH